MAVREIPKAFDYICDVCGKVHRQENAGGHYTDSRPKYWANLVIRHDAHDFQGAAVADATITRLLCDDCCPMLIELINRWAGDRQPKAQP